jgi:3-oxoacyl-[acyl-carrier protein] reductase
MTVRKSIVVTGASSGFGAAFVPALAEDGHRLFICARRGERLAQIAAGHTDVFHAACDVSQESNVAEFFQEVSRRTSSLDAVIHCAAILGPLGTFDTVDSAEWLATISTNVLGAYLVAKYAVPLMRGAKSPRILMLSGGGAFDPMPNVSAYGISKAATVRLVETLAVELKPRRIAVNAIAPGFAATEIHKKTLAAGRERGGEHFEKTVKMMSRWDNSLDVPIDCIRYMLSHTPAKLTGKTISARFDPWGEKEFDENIDQIAASPLYTTQRTTAEHLRNSPLASALAAAAERKRARRGAEFEKPVERFMSNEVASTK